jgi:hypothetical protein
MSRSVDIQECESSTRRVLRQLEAYLGWPEAINSADT